MYKRKTSPTSFSHADRLCDQLRTEQQQSNLMAAKNFVEAILETELGDDFHKALQDGVALCRLINCIRPDTVPSIGRKNIPFVQMANISMFLQGAKDLGLQNSDLFQTVDLYEAKDMTAVINTILTLARIYRKNGKLNGSFGNQKQRLVSENPNHHQQLTLPASQSTHRHVKNIFEQQQHQQLDQALQHTTEDVLKLDGLRHTYRHLTQRTTTTSDVKQHTPLTNDSGYGSLSRQRQNSCSTPTQIMDALNDDDSAAYDGENGNGSYINRQEDKTRSSRCAAKASTHLQVLGIPFIVRKRFSQTSLNNMSSPSPSSTPRRPSPPVKNGSDSIIDRTSSILPPCPVPSRSTPQLPHTLSAPPSPILFSKKKKISLSSSTSSRFGDSSVCAESQQHRKRTTETNDCITPTPTLTKMTRKNSTGLRHQQRLTVRISLRKRGKQTKRSTHFLLGNCVGKGQFGSVYRALDMQTGGIVAIKRIPVEDTNVEDEIMQEVNLLRGMTCPHIVRYIGFAQDDTYMNIVLEYVENGSLLSTLKAFGSLPEKLVASYTYKILKGLEYLHNHDVVHCDLKAANILTTKTGDIKLTDFGVSLNLKIKQEDGKGTPAGTPNWMAPEVIEMKGACPKSDIWSLACTIVELLTGKPPYADLIAMSALYHIVEDDCPPLPPNISKNLQDFMLLCFRKDPACRPTAATLLDHPWLQSIKLGSTHTSSPTESANPPSSPTGTEQSDSNFMDGGTVNMESQSEAIELEWDSEAPGHKRPIIDESDSDDTNSQVTIVTYSNDLLDLVNQHQTHLFTKTRVETDVTCRVCFRKTCYYACICKDCAFVCHEGCAVKATRCFASLVGMKKGTNHTIRTKRDEPWVSSVSPFGVTTFEPSLSPSTPAPPPASVPVRPAFPSHSSSNRLQRFFGIRKKDDQQRAITNRPVYNVLKAAKSVPLLRESQKLREGSSHVSVHPYHDDNSVHYQWDPQEAATDKPCPSLMYASAQHLAPSMAWKISAENRDHRPKRRTKSLQTDKDCIIS